MASRCRDGARAPRARRPPAPPARPARSRSSCRCRPGASGSPGAVELVAGDQERHARPARAAQRGAPDRRRHAELRRPEHRAGAQHHVAGARRPRPRRRTLAPASVSGTRTALARRLGALHRHDSVGALRHRRAGGDPHGRAGLDRAPERVPGARLADHRELGRGPGDEREAVHRRAVERGHVDRAGHVLGEHPAERPSARPARPRGGGYLRQDPLAGLLDRDQVGSRGRIFQRSRERIGSGSPPFSGVGS